MILDKQTKKQTKSVCVYILLCVCVRVCVRVRACERVCVCVRARVRAYVTCAREARASVCDSLMNLQELSRSAPGGETAGRKTTINPPQKKNTRAL